MKIDRAKISFPIRQRVLRFSSLAQAKHDAYSTSKLYKPVTRIFSDYQIPIHYRLINQFLQEKYSPSTFSSLFKEASANGVFRVWLDPESGFIRTTNAAESPYMNNFQWVTDSIELKPLAKRHYPQQWPIMLLRIASFYQQPSEQQALISTLENPDWYRKGSINNGIAHVFEPLSLSRNPDWIDNKRLGSHAAAMKAFCEQLEDSLVPEKLSDFGSEQWPQAELILGKTIGELASYLKAIVTKPDGTVDYKQATTCGAWEELAFTESLTSEMNAIRDSFIALKHLLFLPHYDPFNRLSSLRNQIVLSSQNQWLLHEGSLTSLIKAGDVAFRHRN